MRKPHDGAGGLTPALRLRGLSPRLVTGALGARRPDDARSLVDTDIPGECPAISSAIGQAALQRQLDLPVVVAHATYRALQEDGAVAAEVQRPAQRSRRAAHPPSDARCDSACSRTTRRSSGAAPEGFNRATASRI
jgi:hypothetical protein